MSAKIMVSRTDHTPDDLRERASKNKCRRRCTGVVFQNKLFGIFQIISFVLG